MGGDHGLAVTVPASLDFLQAHATAHIILVGDPQLLAQALVKAAPELMTRIEIVAANEVVLMDDPIEIALRRKKKSSMRLAIEQVKEGRAEAV
ncbi:MAG: phosphate acyltransferase, partial [Burkholderiaceae bacterium]